MNFRPKIDFTFYICILKRCDCPTVWLFHCETIHLIEFEDVGSCMRWRAVGTSPIAYRSFISIDASHSFWKSHKIQFLTMPPIYRMTLNFFLRCCRSSFFWMNSIFPFNTLRLHYPDAYCVYVFVFVHVQSYKWGWWWFVFCWDFFPIAFLATLDAVKINLLKWNHRFDFRSLSFLGKNHEIHGNGFYIYSE